MKFKQPPKPFTPPDIDSFLKEQYWAINEAMHVLTGWPKDVNLTSTTLSIPSGGGTTQLRSIFYLPSPDLKKSPQAFGKRFNNVFLQMKEDIKTGVLKSELGYFSGGVTVLISPEEFILWVLNSGFPIPKDLQKAIDMHQMENAKTKDSVRTKVQRKIVAQFIIAMRPDANISNICEDPLMMQLGAKDKTSDQEQKVIKRAINELFTDPGKAGRPSSNSQNKHKRQYPFEAIPEVMQKDQDGTLRYHFLYLSRALETAMKAKLLILGSGELRKMTIGEAFLEFLKDPIVKLYLPEPSDLLKKFAENICNMVLGTDYLPLPSLIETLLHAATLGIEPEWPIEGTFNGRKYALTPATGKICLF